VDQIPTVEQNCWDLHILPSCSLQTLIWMM